MTVAKLKLCSGRETVRKFERIGWMVARQKGSHVMMTKPDTSGHYQSPNMMNSDLAYSIN